jgi:hypothetical protein
MRKVQGFLCMLLSAAAVTAAAAGSELTVVLSEDGTLVSSAVNWRAGSITMEVKRDLDPSIPSTVRAKQDAETDLEARLPQFFARAVASLRVDSAHTLGEIGRASCRERVY